MKRRTLTLLLFVFHTLCAFAVEYTVERIPNVQLDNRYQFVSNPDQIITPEAVSRIDSLLYQLRQQNSAEVAVVAVKSIGDAEIKPFATELFEHWGIGDAEKDNGLLVLLVENQRKVTFETGYGVEGILPDAICKRIQMQLMIPHFKRGNYSQGMVAGVEGITQILTTPEASEELLATTPTRHFSHRGIDFTQLWKNYLGISVILTLFMLLLVISAHRTSKGKSNYIQYQQLAPYRKYTQLLSFVFPLGMLFIYLWLQARMYALRHKKQRCTQCGATMKRLSEEEDNAYLSPQENTEEQLKSVDYDVWLCPSCHDTQIFRYDATFSHYTECPYCHARAYRLTEDHIVSHSTQFSQGRGEKVYHCNHCKRNKVVPYLLPMIIVSGGGRGGNGGFGGGGFGGGFGGGSSGGGGATSGW